MPATYVSASSIATGSSLTPTVTSFSITAGNAVMFMISVAGNRTCSGYSDTGGGTWSETVDQTDTTRTIVIARCANHPGGTVDVSATVSGTGTPAWSAVVVQVTGVNNATPDADSDSLATADETNTVIYCAQSTGFTIPAGGFGVFVMRINLATTATSAATGWTLISSGSTISHFGYGAFASESANERGGINKASNSRATMAGIAALAEAAAAGGVAGRILGSSFGGRIQGMGG